MLPLVVSSLRLNNETKLLTIFKEKIIQPYVKELDIVCTYLYCLGQNISYWIPSLGETLHNKNERLRKHNCFESDMKLRGNFPFIFALLSRYAVNFKVACASQNESLQPHKSLLSGSSQEHLFASVKVLLHYESFSFKLFTTLLGGKHVNLSLVAIFYVS